MTRLLSLLTFALICGSAVSADEQLTEAEEARAIEIGKTLRCVVCQNLSIEDSNAPLAEDMRRVVRTRVQAGDNNQEVRDYLRERYGDYVLMRPPVQTNTIFLWIAPFIFLIGCGLWFGLRTRRQAVDAPVETLTEEEQARVRAAMKPSEPST